MMINLIPFLQAYCVIDSLTYPLYGIDTEGMQIVTIKRSQQFYLTNKVLELEKCTIIKEQQKKLISVMKENAKDCQHLAAEIDTVKEKNSIILKKKDKYILNLEKQLEVQKVISSSLEQEKNIIAKRNKRKVIGWKVGTFVLASISVASLTAATIIGLK